MRDLIKILLQQIKDNENMNYGKKKKLWKEKDLKVLKEKLKNGTIKNKFSLKKFINQKVIQNN